MTPTDESYGITPSSVIASDHWCLEDALMHLGYDKVPEEKYEALFQGIQRRISVQGYPDTESFNCICEIVWNEIK